jgi:hypothetical protein
MCLTYELGSGTTQEEITGTGFETIPNMMESFGLTKRDFKLIEF